MLPSLGFLYEKYVRHKIKIYLLSNKEQDKSLSPKRLSLRKKYTTQGKNQFFLLKKEGCRTRLELTTLKSVVSKKFSCLHIYSTR